MKKIKQYQNKGLQLMTRQEQIETQVCLAKAAINKYGYTTPAVVKAIRLSHQSRKEFFGYHFEKGLTVGYEGKHDDGSVFEVVAIVNPSSL